MSDRQPIVIMPEDIQRLIGKDAQRNNILAAKMVADIVKTTLGPKGMDKMLVSPLGEIIVTNDGVTILDEMKVEHPAAKMMVEIAKTQESEVGDGTTTSVMLAGKLLENAEKLLDKKIHPTVIVKGYRLAADQAQKILKDLALKISTDNEESIEILRSVAMTAMTGKASEGVKEKFASIIVKAVKQIQDGENIDISNIKIEKLKGDGIEDTELVEGIVIDKERLSIDMPRQVNQAKIAIIEAPFEIKNTEIETKVSISSPEQLQGFLDREERALNDMISKVKSSGANVIFCQKGIDDFAQYLLSKEKIYAVRRVSRSDIEKLSKATGAKIIGNVKDLTPEVLGFAQLVEEIKHGNDEFTFVRGCKNPKAVTILIHGGTEHVIDEVERAIKDGLGDVVASLRNGLVVPGGGAIEIELARRLRQLGTTLGGRERLAVEEFALALEDIPSTLAENAGLDPIDLLTELKSKHDAGDRNAGINLFTNKIEDMIKARIIEPLKIKTQAIQSAIDVTTMILRIDDVIASSDRSGGMPRGMPRSGLSGEMEY
ncbi:thermosome subunit [Candidatus Pacearchaeota archaeon CG10_big_fil_rev_8_21_14_0_10_32_14]|nr:MAG: thermosome subunit [Candidatus Pacearchaeota archaeon CG10_big_fil_rev_8_21_14_0_10_32_14]